MQGWKVTHTVFCLLQETCTDTHAHVYIYVCVYTIHTWIFNFFLNTATYTVGLISVTCKLGLPVNLCELLHVYTILKDHGLVQI